MFTLQYLSKDRRYFNAMLGVTQEEFTKLADRIRTDWTVAVRSHQKQRSRQRAPGAGRKHVFRTCEEQLLVFLLWTRLYPTYLVLEMMVGADEATCCRIIHRMAPLLHGRFLAPPRKGQRKIRSLAELKETYPDVWEAYVDATEQQIQRPGDRRSNRKYRSGKKKRHTVKAQIIVGGDGIILHASETVEGKRHDLRLMKDTIAPTCDSAGIPMGGDLGYQGVADAFPNLAILIPVKRHRGKQKLTRAERAYNRMLSRLRIIVEHTFCRMKQFRALADTFRHRRSFHTSLFHALANVVNCKTLTRAGKLA